MKKSFTSILAALLLAATAASSVVISAAEEPAEHSPALYYDFETVTDGTVKDAAGTNDATLRGNAKTKPDDKKGSNVLYLDGNSSYLELPTGYFDGKTKFTLSLDVCSQMNSENFFTVAIGRSDQQYLFLRTRASEARYAITKTSWTAEYDVLASGEFKNVWTNITLVMNGKKMELYIDGECADTQTNLGATLADFGSDIRAYIGKSFYGGDGYFKGYVDNVKVYDVAMTDVEVAKMLGVSVLPFRSVIVDDESLVTWKADKETKTLTVYTAKSAGANTESATVLFRTQSNTELKDGASVTVKYGTPATATFVVDGAAEETWTVNAVLCGNPVLGGQYADPDIDVFGDTYYLYTTSDGYAGWSGTKFRVFSSKNLVDWTDEGVILDVASSRVKWAVGNAWAPSIEEKDGKYYFYFCAKDKAGDSHIGVAVADSPVGPFRAMDEPLMTVAICKQYGVSMGQAIDPSIFTDDDGSSYMLFGNGAAAIVKLNDDMVSCDLSTLKNYSGVTDFREAITVTKRDGKYHFTWSCDDTGSPNYHVNYGTSNSIYGPIQNRGPILEKDPSLDILGTGHHSILQIPGEDEYYIAYHRFYTPLGTFTDGTGHHRQTCIDKLTFDERGIMEDVIPTLEGVEPRYLSAEGEDGDETEDTADTETAAPETDDTPATTAPVTDGDSEGSGCGAATAAAAVIVTLTATLGCAIVKKK